MDIKTVIIVPCLNEAERLPVDLFCEFAKNATGYHVLFVNDGSTDRTEDVLRKIVDRDPGAFGCLSYPRNRGKGFAIHQGFAEALAMRPRFIAYWDSDLSTPLEEIPRFLDALVENPQAVLVMGVRETRSGTRTRRGLARGIAANWFRTLREILLHTGLTDSQCGAKLLRNCAEVRAAMDAPFKTRWLFDIEIVLRLRCLRAESGNHADPLVTYPLETWEERSGSKLTCRELARAFRELWLLRNSPLPR